MFLLTRKAGSGPLVWQTSRSPAILAFSTEELAYYLASRCQSHGFRQAKAVTPEQAARLPLLSGFDLLLVLDSFDAIDRLMDSSPKSKHALRVIESPWRKPAA
jgi:hypothetical protein